MISVYSIHHATRVSNSRPHKTQPVVWRRRTDTTTGQAFTTYERPALAENKPLQKSDGTVDTFNLGRLILSISQSFTHNQQAAQYDSLWLAQTVELKLSLASGSLTPELITDTTHQTLKQFDELAAIQYAAKHHLITTTRRRGRPSISSK